MHGLMNRSIQRFIADSYGGDIWEEICRDANLGFESFEAMLSYDAVVTGAVLNAACKHLNRRRDSFMEDLGTYLVCHPDLDHLRRLLRFGGDTFVEFLHSLDELPERAKLALPELDFPELELIEHGANAYSLIYRWHHPGFGPLVMGVVRAMADDYGVLAVLEHASLPTENGDVDTIAIKLLDSEFADGRGFELGASG